MKLDVNVLRYLSKEEWRTLTSVEMGQKNVSRVYDVTAPRAPLLGRAPAVCLRAHAARLAAPAAAASRRSCRRRAPLCNLLPAA